MPPLGSLGRAALLGLLLALLPLLARADPLDDGVRRVALQLQCPVCEGQNVADSSSGLAADMRSVIRSKLQAGETDAQILDEFVASYGDGILSEPPRRGAALGVWVGPVAAVAAGAGLLLVLAGSWRRGDRRPAPPPPAPAVVEELRRFRDEVGA